MFSKSASINNPNYASIPDHLDLSNAYAYDQWRKAKLAPYPLKSTNLIIPINDYQTITSDELKSIGQLCEKFNFALYDIGLASNNKRIPILLARQLGLNVSDKHLCGDKVGVSTIHVSEKRAPGEYIPYTNKGINWHTDGYYNQQDQKILSMILHCAQNAEKGGENAFFDYDILYILLRDENPDYIDVLMHDDVMTIPENVQNGKLIRATQTGPVFSQFAWGLHLRYTARTKSILWKKEPLVQKAVNRIQEILQSANEYRIDFRFSPGQGVISNNVLHMRTSFQDSADKAQQRLIYRMRFYERMNHE